MPKTIFSARQERFLKLLREARLKAGLTQAQLSKKMKVHQSFVSKIESGERRVDLIELESICQALKISLSKFVHNYEQE